MLHLNRILCPFEPTSSSAAGRSSDDSPALSQSLYLADKLGATVYVVPTPQGATARGGDVEAPAVTPRDRAEAARSVARDLGVDVSILAADLPARLTPADVLAFVDANNIDLIVVDTPVDRGPIPPMASDPVRTIVERASVPVFIAEHASDPSAIRRVLVPVDFSSHAREALQHAKFLAALYGASIDLLHVMERPQYVALNATDMLAFSDVTLPERKARRRVLSFLATTNGVDVPARVHLAHGNAADHVVHFACEHDIDLVVLSSHGLIGRPQRALGTVADKVLRRVTCPIVLTRAFGRSLVDLPSSVNSG